MPESNANASTAFETHLERIPAPASPAVWAVRLGREGMGRMHLLPRATLDQGDPTRVSVCGLADTHWTHSYFATSRAQRCQRCERAVNS